MDYLEAFKNKNTKSHPGYNRPGEGRFSSLGASIYFYDRMKNNSHIQYGLANPFHNRPQNSAD